MSILTTTQLSLRINDKIICQSANLTFHPGEIWGVLGANGSGKTTLLHTLAGLHNSYQGNIQLHGQTFKKLTPKRIAQSIGLLFQDLPLLFPQTVLEYCLTSRFPHRHYFQKTTAQDQQAVLQALQQMHLEHYLHRSVLALSGGEKRRLMIAALLAQQPEIYLLDEPNNHLDRRHLTRMLQCFQQRVNTTGALVIMSLHDVHLAQQFCQRVLLLFPNGIVKVGSTQTLLTDTHLQALYECETI